jgi:hypothetical protein
LCDVAPSLRRHVALGAVQHHDLELAVALDQQDAGW